jgi:thiamine pyrophosphokinase
MDTVVVVSGGPVEGRSITLPDGLDDAAHVIAADSGADLALVLGLRVDHIVGDFDSISPAAERALAEAGTPTTRLPAEKDATDLELAMAEARRYRPRRVIVVGGRGGRLDHELAMLLLLAGPEPAAADVRARLGDARVTVIRDRAQLEGRPGELVSLLPVHGPARAVTTEGLQYPLRGEDLEAGSTRGISNTFLGSTATVSLTGGILLAVQPEPEEQP